MLNSDDHKVVCFGEILWDILPTGAVPGGAPMNVAYHLHKLGISPRLVTRVGVDKRGEELLGLLRDSNVNTDLIQLDYDIPTGIVNAVPNDHGEMQYDIVSPSAWDFLALDADTQCVVKEANYFIFGSLITRNKTSRDTLFQLLEIAQKKVLDINLRPPHFNRELVFQLLQKADVLKMNLAELELITGWFANYKNIKERIQVIQDKFQISDVIVTMGAEGAMININGKIYSHPGYIVNVADTVGSGDSFLAAFLFKLFENKSPEEALTFASALGAFIASKTGAWPSYERSQIDAFINSYSQKQSFFR
jgi:fructokinase